MTLTRADIGIWLINLPRSTERRARMVAQLQAMGLDYTLFDAVDGRAGWERLKSSVDLPAFRANMGRDVLPGEIGCYQSHLRVWQALLASPHKAALVLEDDVVFHDDFLAALDAALTAGDQWDMLKLNRIRAKVPLCRGRTERWRLNVYIGPATGTGAYLITRELAAKLLSRMLPIKLPVDYEIGRWFAHDFRLLGMEPFPSHIDDGGESTITGTSSDVVRKPFPLRRLGNYSMRLGNYFRRAFAVTKRDILRDWRRSRP